MYSLIRRQPDDPAGSYTESHQGRGQDYDRKFREKPVRALIWDLEQNVLRTYLSKIRADRVVDFACGTGRVTRLLEETLPGTAIMGVDVSPSMLELARQNVSSAVFTDVSGVDLGSVMEPGTIDLVVAFRFFANAEPSLRAEIAATIAESLKPGGHVVVNNHRNFWSSSYLARRIKPGAKAPGYLNSDLVRLFAREGLKVRDSRTLGVLPQTDERFYGLPFERGKRLELSLARRSSRHRAGVNTVFLFQKSDS